MKITKSTLKRIIKEVISEVTPVFPQAGKQKPFLRPSKTYDRYPIEDFKLGGGEQADLLKSLYVGLHDDLKKAKNPEAQKKIKDAIEQVETAFELGAEGLLDIQKDPTSKYTQKDYEGERYGAPDRHAGMPSKPELKHQFKPSTYKFEFQQAKDKVKETGVKSRQEPTGDTTMGGTTVTPDDDYYDAPGRGVRESKITKSTLRQIIREEATKLVEMKRLKKQFARAAERKAVSNDLNKLYTLSVLAPNHDLVTKAGGAEAILEKIREGGYGFYSGLKNPHLNDRSRKIFNQNIKDMYNLAFGEKPAFEGDEDMHTYDSLNDNQKKDLYYKVWDAYNKPGDRGDESIWADDFDYDS